MERLVEFPLEQGGSVLVEIDEPPDGPVMRGLGKDRPTLAGARPIRRLRRPPRPLPRLRRA